MLGMEFAALDEKQFHCSSFSGGAEHRQIVVMPSKQLYSADKLNPFLNSCGLLKIQFGGGFIAPLY